MNATTTAQAEPKTVTFGLPEQLDNNLNASGKFAYSWRLMLALDERRVFAERVEVKEDEPWQPLGRSEEENLGIWVEIADLSGAIGSTTYLKDELENQMEDLVKFCELHIPQTDRGGYRYMHPLEPEYTEDLLLGFKDLFSYTCELIVSAEDFFEQHDVDDRKLLSEGVERVLHHYFPEDDAPASFDLPGGGWRDAFCPDAEQYLRHHRDYLLDALPAEDLAELGVEVCE